MGLCTRHRKWILLITLLRWCELALGFWFMREPTSHLPDEVDHAIAACQGSNMVLNCRNRYNKIVIKDTFYGRQNNHTCASKTFDTDKLCEVPTPDLIKQKIDIMCTGEYKCKVPITPGFLEKRGTSMCPTSRKYLQVTYACHQDPKLHMVCYNNCSSKCWPLCQKECCEPPKRDEAHVTPTAIEKKLEKAKEELTKSPQKLTCHGTCPNRCAPQCDVTCCETKPAVNAEHVDHPKEAKAVHAKISTCIGDCQDICAPLCRPSCCSRHQKPSAVHQKTQAVHSPKQIGNYNQYPHAGPITKPIVTSCPVDCHGHCLPNCPQVCCTEVPKATSPHWAEPLTARMQQAGLPVPVQCPNGCNQRCMPSCSLQCCQYMNNINNPNRYNVQAVPQSYATMRAPAPVQTANRLARPPAVAMTGKYAPQPPTSLAVANARPPQTYAQYNAPQQVQSRPQAVARGGYPPPLVTSQTLEVEVPNTHYSRENPAHTYQRVYPEQEQRPPLGCPQSCARSCDSSCRLGCCANPYLFTTHPIGDDDQRRTYELLLAKYRDNQLQKYYQNSRAMG